MERIERVEEKKERIGKKRRRRKGTVIRGEERKGWKEEKRVEKEMRGKREGWRKYVRR